MASRYARPVMTFIATFAVIGGAITFAQPATSPQPVQKQPTEAQPRPANEAPQDRPVRPGERPRPAQPGGGAEMRSVEGAMKEMGRRLRSLSENIEQADKKDQNLQDLTAFQRAAMVAKGLKPTRLKGDDPAKALDGYRREQIKVIAMSLELETHILDGKTAEAKAMIDKIKAHRDAAHDQYQAEEDEAGK